MEGCQHGSSAVSSMARIVNFNPTPEVEDQLAQLVKVNAVPGKPYQSAAAHPNLNRPNVAGRDYGEPFDTEFAVRYLNRVLLKRYADWIKNREFGRLRSALANKNCNYRRLRCVPVLTDELEVCSVTNVRDYAHADNPYDPDEIKPTWCSFPEIVSITSYDSSPGGTRPGWQASVDGENWFRDTAFRQRAKTLDFRSYHSWDGTAPIFLRLTAAITATAERFGAVTWFAPAVNITWGSADPGVELQRKPMPFAYRTLVQRGLALPAASAGWSHVETIDWFFNINSLRKRGFSERWPIMRMTLAPMPTFGRYHAVNSWAECTAEMDASVIALTR